uniref:Uncharacterized protein n=1 Tax=Ciona savignyi TaxID=51511 RepID=H2YP24_CIOSA
MSSSSNGQLALKQNETIWNESIAEIHGIMEEEELTLLETTTSDTEESFREFSQINVLMSDFESMLEIQEQSVSSDKSTAQDTINVLEA